MKNNIDLNEKEINLLNKLNLKIEDDDLEEKLGDYLTLHCLDDNYIPNKEGEIAYSILDKLEYL